MDKELPKISDRFQIKHKLGQGTFSYIYEAYDKQLGKNVALKVEKKDKSKNILKFEYQVLTHLKGLQHVANAYEYVQNAEQNLIVMDLLGINLAKARRCLEQRYDLKVAIQILMEMVVSVREVHKRGFIHRDVKASNFVLCKENRQVFIVDFGLAKKHLDSNNMPVAKRKSADFRGTVSFASLNAHMSIDLARRDDMWSLYFTMLDFLNEKLEWREQRDYSIAQVKDIKTKCLKVPKKKLWVGPTKGVKEVEKIMMHISQLQYADMPDYRQVIHWLLEIYNNYDMVQRVSSAQNITWELVKKKGGPLRHDLLQLEEEMRHSRQKDFMEYFNSHRSLQIKQTTNKQHLQPNQERELTPVPAFISMNPTGITNTQQQSTVQQKNYQQMQGIMQPNMELFAARNAGLHSQQPSQQQIQGHPGFYSQQNLQNAFNQYKNSADNFDLMACLGKVPPHQQQADQASKSQQQSLLHQHHHNAHHSQHQPDQSPAVNSNFVDQQLKRRILGNAQQTPQQGQNVNALPGQQCNVQQFISIQCIQNNKTPDGKVVTPQGYAQGNHYQQMAYGQMAKHHQLPTGQPSLSNRVQQPVVGADGQEYHQGLHFNNSGRSLEQQQQDKKNTSNGQNGQQRHRLSEDDLYKNMLNDHMQNNQIRKSYSTSINEKDAEKNMILDAFTKRQQQQQLDEKARSKDQQDWRQTRHEEEYMRQLIDQFGQNNHHRQNLDIQQQQKEAPNGILSPANLDPQKKRNAKASRKGVNGMPLQVAQIFEEQVIKRAKYADDQPQGLLLQQPTASSTNQAQMSSIAQQQQLMNQQLFYNTAHLLQSNQQSDNQQHHHHQQIASSTQQEKGQQQPSQQDLAAGLKVGATNANGTVQEDFMNKIRNAINPLQQTQAQNQPQQQANNQMLQMWTPQLQHQSGQMHLRSHGPQQMQMLQPAVGGDSRRRKLPTTAKSHPPPEGFYCYYPEIFDKPNALIFQVVKHPRKSVDQQKPSPCSNPEVEKVPEAQDAS